MRFVAGTYLLGFIPVSLFTACAPGVLVLDSNKYESCAESVVSPLVRASKGPTEYGADPFPEDQGMDFKKHPVTEQWYVAFRDLDRGNKISVKVFSHGVWIDVGAPAFSSGQAKYISLCFVDIGQGIVPVVGFVTTSGETTSLGPQVWVYHAGNWSILGTRLSAHVGAVFLKVVARESDRKLFVAISENGSNGKLMRWNQSTLSWSITTIDSTMTHTHVISSGENFYIAYKGPNPYKLRVRRVVWVDSSGIGTVYALPDPVVTSGVKHPFIALLSGQVYLTYVDQNAGYFKPFVARLNVEATSWSTTAAPSEQLPWMHPKLVFIAGMPYVVAIDYTLNSGSNKRGAIRVRRVLESSLPLAPEFSFSTDQVYEHVPTVEPQCIGSLAKIAVMSVNFTLGDSLGFEKN